MRAPLFSADDFRHALLRLMPQGAIWSRSSDGIPSRLSMIWGQTFARNAVRATNLLADAFPATAVELLPEWENSLGLPDPCAGESPTLIQRRQQVIARLTDNGGSSVLYYQLFAQSLGYDITIKEFAPARAGIMRAGDPVQGEDWAYSWVVSAPGYTPTFFRAGEATSGQPLMTFGNDVLRCEIASRAPAHTIVRFAQSGANLLTDFGGDII